MKHLYDNLTEISIRVNKLEREKPEVEEERGWQRQKINWNKFT